MQKIRILAIAPYKGMKFVLEHAAKQREDVELDIYIGDLEKGVDIVKSMPPDSHDVILSRGGTVEMIRRITGLPVVEISLSVYDILRSIRLAQNYTFRHAIVGFPSITNGAYLLRDLIQRDIDIFTIHSSDEAIQTLHALKADGYQMVIGDMITSSLAKQAGLNSVLITSGAESIDKALDAVVEQHRSVHEQKRLNALLLETLHMQDVQALIFDQQENIVVNTLSSEAQEWKNALKKELPTLAERQKYSYTRKSRDKSQHYVIEAQLLEVGSERFSAFFLSNDLSADYIGIEYIDAEKAEKRYLDSFFISGLQNKEIEERTARYLRAALPLWLEGEPGTGKDCMAYKLYLQSSFRHNPMVLIDCAALDAKGWKYLLGHARSPLQGTDRVIYLKNCEAISEASFTPLAEWMDSLGLRQNKIILSLSESRTANESSVYTRMESYFSAVKITLPPLRESMNEIHNLISLCISTLNMSLGKEIVGVDDEAIQRIQTFPWMENYSQFKRVIAQAMLLTEGNLILGSTLRKLLSAETPAFLPAGSASLFSSDMTLQEYQRYIVQSVLKAENNNQSQAARRLGISRSTLWRMLKE